MTLYMDTTYLSPSEIYQHAINAGFDAANARIATAIAMAESSGNAIAVNPNDPQGSYGLWQINQAAHPGTMAQAMDPAQAAALTYQISNDGANWYPWSTFKNGMYQRYLNVAAGGSGETPPATGGEGTATAHSAGQGAGPTSPAAQSGGFLSSVFSLFIRFWIFIAGVILVAIGGWAMVHEGGSVSNASSKASKAVKAAFV